MIFIIIILVAVLLLFLSVKKSSTNDVSAAKSNVEEQSTLKNELPGNYPSYITSIQFEIVNNKRINLKTGHPLSTNKQIVNSYNLLKQMNTPLSGFQSQTWENKQLDYILPIYSRGDLFYKLGEWEKAEIEWFRLIYLMPEAIYRLSIMYRKEKRFKDVILITEEASKSHIIPKLYASIDPEDIAKAKINYQKHKEIDVSTLLLDDFKSLKGYVK